MHVPFRLALLASLLFLPACSRNEPPKPAPDEKQAGQEKQPSTAAQPAPAGEDKDKPAEAPKEESVVPYASKTLGALQVKTVSEDSGEWFDVLQDGKRAVSDGPPLLNSTVELAPGAYVVSVNRTERMVSIAAGVKTILWTGELVVRGKKGSGDFYAPFQGQERKLANVEPVVNSPVALFAGTYTVKVLGGSPKDLGQARSRQGKGPWSSNNRPSRSAYQAAARRRVPRRALGRVAPTRSCT